MARKIVIVGNGIVGATLAAHLAAEPGCDVTVVDRAPFGQLRGSTGYAPGLIGTLGSTPEMTALAQRSVATYDRSRIGDAFGFEPVGGIEVASSPDGVARLAARLHEARSSGVRAQMITAEQAAMVAPTLIDPSRTEAALLFPDDGTARPDVITSAAIHEAESYGATFIDDTLVEGIETMNGRATAIRVRDHDPIPADDAVIACGIWGRRLASAFDIDLPLVPVGHPYAYGPLRAPLAMRPPFVRWPEHHVYARDHGGRTGIGTYDHPPVSLSDGVLGPQAELAWLDDPFDDALGAALDLLPQEHRFTPTDKLNGVFSMTPDNLPLLGPSTAIEGLWFAEAIWITHAGGATDALAATMLEREPAVDLRSFDPQRFMGQDRDELHERACSWYRDIYAAN